MKKYLYSLIAGVMLFSFSPAESFVPPSLPTQRQVLVTCGVIATTLVGIGIGIGLLIAKSAKKNNAIT